MKKYIPIFLTSLLSAIMAIAIYRFFEEPKVIIRETNASPQYANFEDGDLFSGTQQRNFISSAPTDFISAAELVTPAVVNIKAVESAGFDWWSSGGFGSSSGSGVIISPDGYIVTNNHVIEEGDKFNVTLNDNREFEAKLVGTDPATDLALLKIDEKNMPYLVFGNSDSLRVGEWVLAVGNPLELTSTVTAGIISAKGRDINIISGQDAIEAFIQTDAAVNPGNSGGALVNTRGELVGINTAITSKTGSFVGYSFAVPSNIAKKVIEDLMEFGSVQESVLGILVDRTYDEEGVKIGCLPDESGAKKAGMKTGDIIKKVNNVRISRFSDLAGQLKAKRPGEFVSVTIDRDGKSLTKRVKLSKKIPQFISNAFNWELKNLSVRELKKFGIQNGVMIIRTADDAAETSLKNYIITRINNSKVKDAKRAVQVLDALGKDGRYKIVIEMLSPEGEKESFRFR